MKHLLIFSWPVLLLLSCNNITNNYKQTSINDTTVKAKDSLVFKLEKVAEVLFGPLALENAHDGTDRLFIAEQAGRIMVLKNGELLKEPFLNIRSLLVPIRNEYMDVGILGFGFHPDYKNNGRFFVHYSAPSKKRFDNTSVLAEFKADANNPDKAMAEPKIILEVEQPESNHNGGNIIFDKEGYLYRLWRWRRPGRCSWLPRQRPGFEYITWKNYPD